MINQVIVTGRLTKDPKSWMGGADHKTMGVGFTIAHNRHFRNNRTNEPDKRTTFIRVHAYGRLAHNVMEHLHTARFVLLRGEYDGRWWKDERGKIHRFNFVLAKMINWDFPEDKEKMEKWRKTDLSQLRERIKQLEAETQIITSDNDPDITQKTQVSKPKQGETFFVDDGPIGVFDGYLDDDPDPMKNEPNL